VLAPATLAALPSTRAILDRDVFYVARNARSIQCFSFSAFSLFVRGENGAKGINVIPAFRTVPFGLRE
jgi:hypothetical protein